jgi:hypothetical protein
MPEADAAAAEAEDAAAGEAAEHVAAEVAVDGLPWDTSAAAEDDLPAGNVQRSNPRRRGRKPHGQTPVDLRWAKPRAPMLPRDHRAAALVPRAAVNRT